MSYHHHIETWLHYFYSGIMSHINWPMDFLRSIQSLRSVLWLLTPCIGGSSAGIILTMLHHSATISFINRFLLSWRYMFICFLLFILYFILFTDLQRNVVLGLRMEMNEHLQKIKVCKCNTVFVKAFETLFSGFETLWCIVVKSIVCSQGQLSRGFWGPRYRLNYSGHCGRAAWTLMEVP